MHKIVGQSKVIWKHKAYLKAKDQEKTEKKWRMLSKPTRKTFSSIYKVDDFRRTQHPICGFHNGWKYHYATDNVYNNYFGLDHILAKVWKSFNQVLIFFCNEAHDQDTIKKWREFWILSFTKNVDLTNLFNHGDITFIAIVI